MTILTDIVSEKVKLVKVIQGSKLGKNITDTILFPILDNFAKEIPEILNDTAQWITNKLTDYLLSSMPSGRSYEIVEYDPEAPRGHRRTFVGIHTSSISGETPAPFTETLAHSIEYEIDSNGSFRFGLLKKYGEYSDAHTESKHTFSQSKITLDPRAKATPVGTYGRALNSESGFDSPLVGHVDSRPWFKNFTTEVNEELRQRLRKKVRLALNKSTRKISVRRAIILKVYFREGEINA